MFFFRINKLKIIDNHENRHVLRVFGADQAEIKLASFIATDQTRLPEMDELLITRDPRRQRELMAAAVASVIGSRVLTTIQNVKDNHEMTFGDTGFVLYQSERIPDYLDWILLAIESDFDVREIGQEMSAVVNDPGFDNFLSHTLTLAAAAANPSFLAAVGIGKFVAKTFAQRLQKNQDDMLGVLYTSLNRREHYPHGERKKDQVPDLTNNMLVDYSLFGFESPPQSRRIERLPPLTPPWPPSDGIQPRRRWGA
jgi:hypothetical protein